jgi:hypothetical protein
MHLSTRPVPLLLLIYFTAALFSVIIIYNTGNMRLLYAEDKRQGTTTGDSTGRDKADKNLSEDKMFGEGETVAPSDTVKDDAISTIVDRKSVTFTGFLNSRTSVKYKRDSILRELDILDTNNFLSYFQSNFELDARLIKGVRGYVNFSADYYPAGLLKSTVQQSFLTYPFLGLFDYYINNNNKVPVSYLGIPAYYIKSDILVVEKVNAAFAINEVFLDVNIAKAVYFRIGKQVLKWGVGYLWTPTDMINVDKKDILDWSQVRQGTYGFKMHIPFGTRANIYSFVDFKKAKNLSDLSMANKLEFLFGNTEMALSVLLKKKNMPVYGLDFTSRLLEFDIHGEASISYGDNVRRVSIFPWYLSGRLGFPVDLIYYASQYPGKSSILDYRVHGKWTPRASFGFGRGFEVMDIKDRLRLDFEVFYNHAGYDRKIFEKDPYTVAYFVSHNLYQPNYYGKFYAGAFITIKQMFVEELSASVNCVVNIQDQSTVVSGMLTYSPFYDLYLNLTVSGFVGKKNREYTVFGNYGAAELSVKLVF